MPSDHQRSDPDQEVLIHIVGLGPGNPSHVTAQSRELLGSGLAVILRTRHHPSVAVLAPAAEDCDDLYRASATFEDAYLAIVDRVLSKAAGSPVVFAVPGSPNFAERTVSELLREAAQRGVRCRLYPAVSFVDVAVAALGIDGANIQICDATDLRVSPDRPALIHQVFDRDTATSTKLRLLDLYPPEHEVTVLHSAGGDDERVERISLADLDHRPFGYLDSLYLPPLEPLANVRTFDGLLSVVRRLLGPGGCPWDREQTHESLRPYLLEESYEALEAIDSGDESALSEELGDVLFQAVIHTVLAETEGAFTMSDVVAGITSKLIRRHPHVFGDGTASTAAEVEQNWEQLKKAEKARESVLDGVPKTLPALAASQAIQGRARKVGFDWPDIDGPLAKLQEEIEEFARSESPAERLDEFGDILFVLVNIADHLDIDSEQALRGANGKFRRRFNALERLAASRDMDLRAAGLDALDALWNEVKAGEKHAL